MKMKIINWETPDTLEKCIEVLNNDGIITYQTDTLKGLGCNARSPKAIKKINKIKRRKSPISIMVNSKKSIIDWLIEYSYYHKDPKNKMIHWVWIPLIMFSVFGLLSLIKFDLFIPGIKLNLLHISILAASYFLSCEGDNKFLFFAVIFIAPLSTSLLILS